MAARLGTSTSQYAPAPASWLVGERRKRSTQANIAIWLGFLSSLAIAVDDETKAHAFANTVNPARDHNLSVYDAAYLELAMRRGLPRATLDDKLKTAARAVAHSLLRSRLGWQARDKLDQGRISLEPIVEAAAKKVDVTTRT